MPDYIFKTYLADGREHFLYGEMGDSQAQLTKKDFPFPESLLRLLYLDIWAYDGQIKQFDKLLMELYRTREEKCARQLLPLLDELAELHIYFQLLRLDWRARLKEAQRRNYENILDLLPHKEITHIPSNIHTIQNQALGLIQKALDMDGRKGSLEKKLEDYYALPDERRVELLNGVIYDMAAPSTIHQFIIPLLTTAFHAHIMKKKGKCIVFPSPVDVQIDCDDRTMLQPDVLILCDRSKLIRRCIMGAGDRDRLAVFTKDGRKAEAGEICPGRRKGILDDRSGHGEDCGILDG